MIAAYYNKIDPFAAQWLRNLIAEGLIAPGDVDERSIVDVRPDDLLGYAQRHFFAGIGGWSYALRLAGVPDDRPIWTGSCPCQSLSSAGQRKGHADERHLWPAFYRLIAEFRPATVFGEQVASADGREWLAGVRADLEDLGYACGAADLCAAGVAAPHIRQRLYWVADADRKRCDGQSICVLEREPRSESAQTPRRCPVGRMGDSGRAGLSACKLQKFSGSKRFIKGRATEQSGCSPWSSREPLHCRDGYIRSAKPGIFPLAHGVSARMGKLRGAGNAIVPQVAALFIRAFSEAVAERAA